MQQSFRIKLEVPTKFPYTDRMKNKITDRLRAQEINLMNEDDKSMHIFYTLDEIENLVKSLHKKMDENDPTLGQKIVTLENIIETLERMHSRCEVSAKFLQTPTVTA
jgi:hypothetical protein